MSDVSCRAFAYFRALAREGLLDLEQLYARTRIPREVLNDPRAFAAWDDWIHLVDEAAGLMGLEGPALEKTAIAALEPGFAGPLLGVVGLVADCRDLYRVVMTWFCPSVFRPLRFSCRSLGANELELVVEIPEPHRPSMNWFLMAAEGFRAVPRLLGHPHSASAHVELGERLLRMRVTVPASRTLWARLKRLSAFWRGSAEVLDELTAQQQRLISSHHALEESQRATRLLLQALPDAVLHLSPDARVQSVELGGASRDLDLAVRWRAHRLGDLGELTPALSAESVAQLVAAHASAVESASERSITVALAEEGRERTLDWRFMPSGGGDVIALVRDVTEARTLERQLAVTERMATVGTLAAGVAHDLNNPLTYVTANLELARIGVERLTRGDSSCIPELLPMLDDALAGAMRAQRLVADLKVFSRVERRHEPRAVDLAGLAESAIKLTASAVRQRAEVRLTAPIPVEIAGDAGRLSQVFVNLLANASQALARDAGRERRIEVRVIRDEDGRSVVEVEDNGVGMGPEVQAHLFEPFFTTKPAGEGTGLGLSICRRIVAEHDGSILVTSAPGKGSTFRIVFPASRAASPAPASSTTASELLTQTGDEASMLATQRFEVLIVDDDALVGRALSRALRDHAVEFVSSGAEALARLSLKRFDVVVCDVMMPGMTGVELYERVRSNDPTQSERFLFVSGGVLNKAADQFLADHGHRFLSKPVQQAELLLAVDSIARGAPVVTASFVRVPAS